jgi:hypothetical protein
MDGQTVSSISFREFTLTPPYIKRLLHREIKNLAIIRRHGVLKVKPLETALQKVRPTGRQS